MAIPETTGISNATTRLRELLQLARQLKQTPSIDPPLPASEFQGENGLPRLHYPAVEHAANQIFQARTASTSIHHPDFVEIWNLLDILNICGDQEQCEPSLAWWRIEELLETQSIDGCRVVFDYLESRRERLVARHFGKKKDMVILRAFNELLRRLSRAEEAVFCGRVFIWIFQSFPLGDRSSVNVKGDFHKENLTTFESNAEQSEPISNGNTMTGVTTDSNQEKVVSTGVTPDASALSTEEALYPAFWTMQGAFSNPPEFFFKENRMEEFKVTLQATLAKFREVPRVNQAAADNKRGVKRKAGDAENQDEFASTFNPKYLTSRELFTLELSDLAFQRHILVQALILLDFLLSLTDKVKNKTASFAKNKSLQFEFTLSEQDTEWAETTRKAISSYLTDGQLGGDQEGKYYHRMVETVLSRDKNWVRWKLEFCNQIKKPPIYSGDFASSRDGAKKICRTTVLRSSPMGALDLRFLTKASVSEGWDGSSETARSTLPNAETLVRDVEGVDLDLEMAATDEEKRSLQDAKSSKTWRALRLMSKTKLSLFDQVDDGRNLKCFVQPHGVATGNIERGENTVEGGDAGNDSWLEEGSIAQEQVEPLPSTAMSDISLAE